MRYVLGLVAILFLSTSMAAAGVPVNYSDGDQKLTGYLATPENAQTAPIVMIVNQWKGLGDYEKKRADMLAELGYVAFAIDMYGTDVRPDTVQAAGAESSKYKDNPDLARQRLKAALDKAKMLEVGDKENIAVIGYCFGGTMALELARMGADIDGVVSFHGGLNTQRPAKPDSIIPEIVVHHGAADPHVPAADVAAFMKEMETAGPDLSFYAYADAVHAFTEKSAGDDPSTGAAYNAHADKLSWDRTLAFFERIF